MISRNSRKSSSNLENYNQASLKEIEEDYQILFSNSSNLFNARQNNIIESQNDIENQSRKSDRSQIFEQIDNVLLSNKNQSRQQYLLKLKVDELERFCDDLLKDNQKLTHKIEQLFEEKQSKMSQTAFVDELSQMNTDFGQVQKLLKEYRDSLGDYQKKFKLQTKIKDQKIEELTKNLTILTAEDINLKDRLFQLEKTNQKLQYRIDVLQKQIKINEGKIVASDRAYTHRYKSSVREYSNKGDFFDNNVQQELEILIEKLMGQLEYQRSNKKKMMDEIRRLARQVQVLDQEIKEKDNRIYSLEHNLTRNERYGINESRKSGRDESGRIEKNDKFNQQKRSSQCSGLPRSKSSRALKNFTLEQILEDKVSISDYEKMLLIRKILEYYSSRMERRIYKEINPRDLLIFNYNSQHLNMLAIRQTNPNRRSHQGNVPKMLWNMAFNIVSLVNEVNPQNIKTIAYQRATNNMLNVLESIVKTPQQELQQMNNFCFDQLDHYLDEYFRAEDDRHNYKDLRLY